LLYCFFADVSSLIRTCDDLCFSSCGSGASCCLCVTFCTQPQVL